MIKMLDDVRFIFYISVFNSETSDHSQQLVHGLLPYSWGESPQLLSLSSLYFSSHSTRLLAASTLRTVLGTRSLAEILSERETISHTMQTALDEATDPWGVKVERVEMWIFYLDILMLHRLNAASLCYHFTHLRN